MEKQDEKIICKDCGKEFFFTVRDQEFYEICRGSGGAKRRKTRGDRPDRDDRSNDAADGGHGNIGNWRFRLL